MIVFYLWFTFRATEWRMSIRRTMNDSDNEANTKAIDSLLNYETVKYFGAEARETRKQICMLEDPARVREALIRLFDDGLDRAAA